MIGKARVLFICILVAMVSSCAGKPVFTVEVLKTATPFQVTSEAPTAISTVSVTIPTAVSSAASLAPESLPMPADFSPLLYGKKYDANTFFVLLGGIQGSAWLTPQQTVAQFAGPSDYNVYTASGQSFQVEGHAMEFSAPSQAYFIGTDVNLSAFGMFGVAPEWPVRQGTAQELSVAIEVYQDTVMDWVKGQGISEPILGTLHIFRIDLEGDGVDEIFISCTYLAGIPQSTLAGDYSIVLMRKVVGGEVLTVPLVADIYHSKQVELTFPTTYSIASFLDLNGDGILEVVIDFERWEGFGALIYQIDGQNVTKVLGE